MGGQARSRPLHDDGRPDDGRHDDGRPDDGRPDDGRPDDGGPDWLEVIQLEKRAGLSPDETLRRLRGALRAEDRCADHVCFYMADIVDRQLWRYWGHPTQAHFAKHRLGVDPRTLRGRAQVGRDVRAYPLVRQKFEEGALKFGAVRALLKVITPQTEQPWVERATQVGGEVLKAQLARKKKGDLPTDPDKRRIHDITHRVVLDLDDTDYVLLERVRAMREAELGSALTNVELVRLVLAEGLCNEHDEGQGKQPGRKRVSAEHYQILASPLPGGDPDELVTEDEHGDPIVISRARLAEQLRPALPPRELVRPETIREASAHGTKQPVDPAAPEVELVYGDTSWIDPRNNGPFAPEEERDAPTSSAMREQVLKRDRRRCLVCGGRTNLAAHHLRWRRYGGRTVPSNLATVCERCHSMIHARRTVILGDMQSGLKILDNRGQPFRPAPDEPFVVGGDAPVPPPAAGLTDGGSAAELTDGGSAAELTDGGSAAGPAPSFEPALELATLPAEVDGDWLAEHGEQFTWNERQGVLELSPHRHARAWERNRGSAVGGVAGAPERNRGSASEEGSAGLAEGYAARVPAIRLGELVGQSALRDTLWVAIGAARAQGEPLRHLLFSGRPGLGKTLLAQAVAGELGAPLVRVPAQVVKSPEAILRALTSLRPGAVLFMDELQALGPRWAELLYEALDPDSGGGPGSGAVTLLVRDGLAQRSLRVRLPAFTFVGATTDEDLVPAPLRSRLEVLRLEPYGSEELAELLARRAAAKGLRLTPEGAARLAGASRGTPRAGLQLLNGVRDEASIGGGTVVDAALVEQALARRGIDAQGLTPLDRAYLAALARAGEPVALSTLAATLSTSEAVLSQVVEPHLKHLGLIRVTPRGRVLVDRSEPPPPPPPPPPP